MIRRCITGGLIAVMAICSSARTNENTDDTSPSEKNGSTGTIIAISLGAAVTGIGGFFLIRRMMRERAYADSVIGVVERAWNDASALYARESYRDALHRLRMITGIWYEYNRCITKYRRRYSVNPDTIRSVIASCDFLERMIGPVKSLSEYAERLPVDDYGLQRFTRQELKVKTTFLRTQIDSILNANPNHRNGLLYSFRHIEDRIRKVDTLVAASYPQQRADFMVKNKFYYNQANRSGDTAALHRFVEDCNYFQIEKEWCHRARLALTASRSGVNNGMALSRTMTTEDSIVYDFKKVMASSKIEDLETYLKKYSSRRYRKYAGLVKQDEVTAALRILRNKIDTQIAFNRKYPRLNNERVNSIDLTFKGLSKSTEDVFRLIWKTLESDMAKIPVRFPAYILLDYTHEPPVLIIDAIIDPVSDITTSVINERPAYRIEGLLPLVTILYRLKKGVVTHLKMRTTGPAIDEQVNYQEVVNYTVNKVNFAAYVIRLKKPENAGMMMFYAKDCRDQRDTTRLVEFYDFYDMAVVSYPQRRFPIYPTSLPNIIPSLSSDSLEQVMGIKFFSAREE